MLRPCKHWCATLLGSTAVIWVLCLQIHQQSQTQSQIAFQIGYHICFISSPHHTTPSPKPILPLVSSRSSIWYQVTQDPDKQGAQRWGICIMYAMRYKKGGFSLQLFKENQCRFRNEDVMKWMHASVVFTSHHEKVFYRLGYLSMKAAKGWVKVVGDPLNRSVSDWTMHSAMSFRNTQVGSDWLEGQVIRWALQG